MRDGRRKERTESHDGSVGLGSKNSRKDEVGESSESNELLSTSSRDEGFGRGVSSDSSQLSNSSASELDSDDVRRSISDSIDFVGREVDSSSGSRVV